MVTSAAGLAAGAWALSGWWCAGVGWSEGTGGGSEHVWMGRGRVEVFGVPYGACGYLPPVGVVSMPVEDLLEYSGLLGNFVEEEGSVSVPLAARWRWGVRGGVRGGWAIPGWPVVIGLAGWGGALWLGRMKRGEGACVACGYSMAGLACGARCPECGVAGGGRYHRVNPQEKP